MKCRNFKEKALCFMLLAMPNLLLANGSGVWQSNALQTIINFTSGPFMKAIGAIIVICVGIYVVKNLDRLGEIAWIMYRDNFSHYCYCKRSNYCH